MLAAGAVAALAALLPPALPPPPPDEAARGRATASVAAENPLRAGPARAGAFSAASGLCMLAMSADCCRAVLAEGALPAIESVFAAGERDALPHPGLVRLRAAAAGRDVGSEPEPDDAGAPCA